MACCGRGIESLVDGLAPLWSATRGDPRVCIAVLDGTVDTAHAAFDGARLRQLRTSASFTPAPPSRHGTHVASVLFGQHDGPVPGVAPQCQGAIVPVFRQTGSGQLAAASQLDLARAISLALTVGANVINISGGKYDPTGEPEPYLAQVIELCAKQNVLVVAAAGNDGCACPHVPAASPWVLAVGAMDERGEPLESSNWSSAYRSHGVLAPGRGIPGADPGGGQVLGTGTSFATAVVSGVAGLLMSVQLKKDGTIDARAVHDAILRSTKGCEEEPYEDCNRLLGGRLDVARAWKLLTENEANMMSNRDEFYAGPETHPEGKSPVPNMSPGPGCSPCNSAVEPASENNVGRAGMLIAWPEKFCLELASRGYRVIRGELAR